ncbi:MAG: hypothetical protein M1812_002461 [Candelaria pacifica]|nr:MAG: hypothetical protein M1812_002461 [Candelaria pacifica]
MAPSLTDDPDSLLNRLTHKPGVQSTLVLSRIDGCIVRTTGLLSTTQSRKPNGALSPSKIPNSPDNGYALDSAVGALELRDEGNEANRATDGGMKDAEEVARMVWNFVRAAGTMVEGLDAEDEVKLLRLRTRKNELVIVPGMCLHVLSGGSVAVDLVARLP